MIHYTMSVTPEEKALLDDIREIQHGSLMNVKLDGSGRTTIVAKLTSSERALVELIRSGVVSFRTIKIFEGQPTMVEVHGKTTRGGHACVETHKLN